MKLKMSIFKCFIALLAVGGVLLNSPAIYAAQSCYKTATNEDYLTWAYSAGGPYLVDGAIRGEVKKGIYTNKNKDYTKSYKTVEYSIYKIQGKTKVHLKTVKGSSSKETAQTPDMDDGFMGKEFRELSAYREYYGVVRKGDNRTDIAGSIFLQVYRTIDSGYNVGVGVEHSSMNETDESLTDGVEIVLPDESVEESIVE